jgi:hypothetical protein
MVLECENEMVRVRMLQSLPWSPFNLLMHHLDHDQGSVDQSSRTESQSHAADDQQAFEPVPKGAIVRLPLWLARVLELHGLGQVMHPLRGFSKAHLQTLRASPQHVELPCNFYALAHDFHHPLGYETLRSRLPLLYVAPFLGDSHQNPGSAVNYAHSHHALVNYEPSNSALASHPKLNDEERVILQRGLVQRRLFEDWLLSK